MDTLKLCQAHPQWKFWADNKSYRWTHWNFAKLIHSSFGLTISHKETLPSSFIAAALGWQQVTQMDTLKLCQAHPHQRWAYNKSYRLTHWNFAKLIHSSFELPISHTDGHIETLPSSSTAALDNKSYRNFAKHIHSSSFGLTISHTAVVLGWQ